MVQTVKLPECSLSRFFFSFLVCFKIKIYEKKNRTWKRLWLYCREGAANARPPISPLSRCVHLYCIRGFFFAFLRTPISRDVMMGDDALPFITRQPTRHSPGYRGEDVRRLRVCLLAHPRHRERNERCAVTTLRLRSGWLGGGAEEETGKRKGCMKERGRER